MKVPEFEVYDNFLNRSLPNVTAPYILSTIAERIVKRTAPEDAFDDLDEDVADLKESLIVNAVHCILSIQATKAKGYAVPKGEPSFEDGVAFAIRYSITMSTMDAEYKAPGDKENEAEEGNPTATPVELS